MLPYPPLCRFWLSEAGLHALPSKLSTTSVSSLMLASNNKAIVRNNVSYGPVFTMSLLRHSGHQGNHSFFQNSVELFSVILTAVDYYNNDSSAVCFLHSAHAQLQCDLSTSLSDN